ncbi:hypothetical protein ESCO_006784 [Escovopsis weberi]|uniref:N-acetyltransferase domain-containing protein n=1 Tax=Escovopsis weberi TaxID=150374 RepID=A0A0M9VVT3_ESCWE|nr:hypothetical protein ESCO_006784 [Escovopsis weberi]
MYLVRHQIESGHSLGVFDSEYVLKRDESVAEGGKLYWDLDDPSADGDKLLEQMDFPLVSVALAYDGINPLDPQRMAGLMACLPAFSAIYRTLTTLDKRDPESWKPKAAGEVLVRNATSTRHEYEGQGVMKNMARAMMFAAAEKGFRGIEIVCLSDAVTHVWSHPPEPFRGEIVCQFHTATFEEQDEEGNLTNPFHPASQMATKVYCHLR